MATPCLSDNDCQNNPGPVLLSEFVESMEGCIISCTKGAESSAKWHALAEAFRLTLATTRTLIEDDGDKLLKFSVGARPVATNVTQSSEGKVIGAANQYHSDKKNNDDALLLYQYDGYYEAFFDDAITIARELRLALTMRKAGRTTPIPVCGMLEKAAGPYMNILLARGYRMVFFKQIINKESQDKTLHWRSSWALTPGTSSA
ncbi:MutS N-terminal domain-containing protein [Solidesulfovibrio sp.]